MAVLQANYGKTNEEIVHKVIESCKTALTSSLEYHKIAEKLMADTEPMLAKQHASLAMIYASLTNRTKELENRL